MSSVASCEIIWEEFIIGNRSIYFSHKFLYLMNIIKKLIQKLPANLNKVCGQKVLIMFIKTCGQVFHRKIYEHQVIFFTKNLLPEVFYNLQNKMVNF